MGEPTEGKKGLFQGVGGGDSLVYYSQSLCHGECVAPYSVIIVPFLGLSDLVLLPGPGGKGERKAGCPNVGCGHCQD